MYHTFVEIIDRSIRNALMIEQELQREPQCDAEFDAMLVGLTPTDLAELPLKMVQQFRRIADELGDTRKVPSIAQATAYVQDRLNKLDELPWDDDEPLTPDDVVSDEDLEVLLRTVRHPGD